MIKVILSELNFENDIGPLVRAFFPGKQVSVELEAEADPGSEDHVLLVRFEKDSRVCFDWKGEKPCKRDEPWSDERIELKNRIKRCVYGIMRDETGKELPWGALTGIRPVKLALGGLLRDESESEIRLRLKDEYLVSDEKINTALSVARKEASILRPISRDDSFSLYVDIPFCPSICLYCTFSSSPISENESLVSDYLEALKTELSAVRRMMEGRKLISIYFGGGTPTSISAQQLGDLMSYIRDTFDMSFLREWTVEAGRPDSITEKKLSAIREECRKAGVRERISINPQTMNDKTLELIGRYHSTNDVEKAFELARSAGIATINTDMILGLPGEGMDEVAKTVERIGELGLDNLTIHSLALKTKSRLNQEWEKWQDSLFDSSDEIMRIATDAAEKMGMEPYYLYRQKNMAGNLENVGFAKPGTESLYNMLIMEEWHHIVACGASAASKMVYFDEVKGWQVKRCENVKNISQYIERIHEMIARKEQIFC